MNNNNAYFQPRKSSFHRAAKQGSSSSSGSFFVKPLPGIVGEVAKYLGLLFGLALLFLTPFGWATLIIGFIVWIFSCLFSAPAPQEVHHYHHNCQCGNKK